MMHDLTIDDVPADCETIDSLPDTQSQHDERGLRIHSAGVGSLRLPFEILDVDGTAWHTVVDARLGVAVPAQLRSLFGADTYMPP